MNPTGGGARSTYFRHATGLFVVVFLGYASFAVLAWQSFGGEDLGPAFFPAAGITVAALLLSRPALWPAVLAAILLAETAIDLFYGVRWPAALGYAAANTIEPLLGATLVRAWCKGPPDLRDRRGFGAFLVGACVIAPLAGGLIGGWISAQESAGSWPGDVFHWAAGDGIGVLVVGSPILLWRGQYRALQSRPVESVLVFGATAVFSLLGFSVEAPPAMLILPVLAWAAFRFNMLGAALSGLIMAFTGNLLTRAGRGLFLDLDVSATTRLALTQLFIAVVVVVAMLIAQEAAERNAAEQARESERRERLRLEGLAGLAQQLSAALSPREIGEALADQVLNEGGARAVNVGLLSADGSALEWTTMEGYPGAVIEEYAGSVPLRENTVATETVRTGEPVIIHTAEEYARRYPEKVHWLEISRAQSVVGWPLTGGGTPMGALLLVWSEPQPLDTAQLAYVSAVGTMVAQSLVRARVYADEHARAALLQSAVLPTRPDNTCGFDICITYEPADVAQGLGGDWYDVMPLPKDRTYFAVGDVVGHGLPAVEDMAQLRSAGRALAHQGLAPSQLLAELNGFTRHASQGKFATMAVAVFDPAAGTLAYGSGGHPPPLLRRGATGEVIRLSDAQGPVLGPVEQATFADGTVRVDPGDILVLYTDGLVERRGMDLETGISRASAIIAGWEADTVLPKDCEGLLEALAARPRTDDICVIAVRFSADNLPIESLDPEDLAGS